MTDTRIKLKPNQFDKEMADWLNSEGIDYKYNSWSRIIRIDDEKQALVFKLKYA